MVSSKRYSVLKISFVFLIIPVCYLVFYEYSDLFNRHLILSKLNKIGLSILIIFVPYLVIVLSDSFGWNYSFGNVKNQISLAKLFLLRLATEALQTSLPGGAVYAEIVRPFFLKKYFHLEHSDSISANIITKVNILIAQVLFFIIGMGILIISLRDTIFQLLLPDYLFYPASAILIILPILITYLLYRKNLILKCVHLFKKIHLKPIQRLLHKIDQPANNINKTISLFSVAHKRELGLTIAIFFSTWILMSLESLVILQVIGVNSNILQVIIIESLISFVRMIFFFIPGAVGPQDVLIIILFNLVGIPNPESNAVLFVLLKRIKELFWIVTGYILLIMLGVRPYRLIKSKRIDFTPVKENL